MGFLERNWVCLELKPFRLFVGTLLEPWEFGTFCGHSPEILMGLWLACDHLPNCGGKKASSYTQTFNLGGRCSLEVPFREYLLQLLCILQRSMNSNAIHAPGLQNQPTVVMAPSDYWGYCTRSWSKRIFFTLLWKLPQPILLPTCIYCVWSQRWVCVCVRK